MSRAPGDANTDVHQDLHDIALAHKYRLSLTMLPTQSSFRVMAIVYYKDNSTNSNTELPLPITIQAGNHQRPYVVGTNDEPGYIGGSICAERAALVQLRFLPFARVTKIVIVTDHEQPISPGMLCREFMAGHAAVPWDVPIVLAGSGSDACSVTKTTLRLLYPHPSPYSRLTAAEADDLGKRFSAEDRSERTRDRKETRLPDSVVQRLMRMAQEAAHQDMRKELHPIQFGAAVLFDNDTIVSASQKKALEYGATLDAISQLASDIVRQDKVRPVALVQVDAHGVAHAPFAPARAFLSEHGYGDCLVLVHRYHEDNRDAGVTIENLMDVAVSELAPCAPDMWSV